LDGLPFSAFVSCFAEAFAPSGNGRIILSGALVLFTDTWMGFEYTGDESTDERDLSEGRSSL